MVPLVSDARRLSALVADSESVVRRNLASALAGMGIETHEASRGEDVLEIVSQVEIHLMVVDSDLPAFGGLETIRVIRTFGAVPPFLLLASSLTRELRMAALDWQASSVLQKPIDAVLLSDIVRRVVYRSYGREA